MTMPPPADQPPAANHTPGSPLHASVRTDLIHLTPEALTQLTNAGLVKRAQREYAAGYQPSLTLLDDATLVAEFPDGITTRWPAGRPIAQAQCNCVATSMCRHRIIAALRFRDGVISETPTTTPHTSTTAPPPQQPDPPSPGQASDALLAALLAPNLLAHAAKVRDAGLVVQTRRRQAGEPCDTARLPAATVRFWAGSAIEAARCDCIHQSACEHVALGVWAFRLADAHAPAQASTAVQLGTPASALHLDSAPYLALLATLLQHGVVNGPAASAQALSVAQTAARASGAQWLELTLLDMGNWVTAYTARSARYAIETGADLAAELVLRLKQGAAAGQAKAILGVGQPGQVALDSLRLMCLGARTERDGPQRLTRLVLADVDTGTRMVLMHPWQVPADQGEAAEAALRAQTRLAPGLPMRALVSGQLLAQQAKRLADGQVQLSRTRTSHNSLLPQSGDWSPLPMPLKHTRVADLRHERNLHPHRLTQERRAARTFTVFSPHRVDDVLYDPYEQTVQCVAYDADGEPLLVRRSHETHNRQALALLAAIASGAHGPVRHLSGTLRWLDDLPLLEPWSVVCNELLVLDFAPSDTRPDALASLPLGQLHQRVPRNPLLAALDMVRALGGAVLHHGAAQLPGSWQADAATAAAQLHALGLTALSQALTLTARHVSTFASQGSGGAALADQFARLMGLRQLHEDALAVLRSETQA
ncbi:MAG: hypothetical protein Q7J58_04400 [Hydrogenophaga sp.]|uniref:hypothetical protein n=2 Tax=Hydrogenophaga sp. TaxID=1904254 RepID=UPI00271EE0D8|nr:hypothetical protein [Hydrogenophaga sp.]MDO9568604.1 hypothetical protein [Hydrogenophaga sp.]